MQLLLCSQLCQRAGGMRLGQAALLGTLLPAALPLRQPADMRQDSGRQTSISKGSMARLGDLDTDALPLQLTVGRAQRHGS